MSDAMPIPVLQPHPAYKPSGVPWLGDVPQHWEVPRLKDIGYLKSGAGFPHSYQGNLSAEFPFFKVGDMAASGNERLMQVWNHTVSIDTVNSLGAHVFLPNTIVFAKVGAALLLNRRRVLTRPSCIDNNMMGFLPRGHSPEWMCNWLSAVDFRMLVNPGAVPSVNEGQLEVLPVFVPPLPEQQAIVRYLDFVDRRIRRYVAAKRKLIALLEEEKQAVVNRAVTRGLDPNVRLKPSGVEWLGDVPEHWEVTRVKTEFFSLNHRRVPLSAVERGAMTMHQYDYYGASGVIDRVEDYLFDDKLLLVAEDGANLVLRNLPLAIIASGKFWVNNHAHILKPRRGNLDYLAIVMEGLDYRPWISGAAQPKLTLDRLMRISIAVPPRVEQDEIIARANAQTSGLTAAIARARRQIELVQEYRTRLIADVVTGKLDVREGAAQLPDESDEDYPIDGDSLISDNMNDGTYEAGQPAEEELAMESEVSA